ncbi:hypothetical protein SAMD00023353_2400510 [Rosellinia necatrix]|uniref:Uncharacterized protein n=1 Tax=Rosellinia necatrix TaxID=77044 RepID=A0A1S8A862_ROSNE|nr:hypothetical protein SAMD00023353_2400510 [Rosellinia necatrix]
MVGHPPARLEANELIRSTTRERNSIPVDNPVLQTRTVEVNSNRESGLSRAERRFQRLRMAQQARLEAEIQLNNRLEEESRMTQEFNSMQLKLEQLLISKATMVIYPGAAV